MKDEENNEELESKGALTEMFRRDDKSEYDPEGEKTYTWKYYSYACPEIIIGTTGTGEGDAGHGGVCRLFIDFDEFMFNVETLDNKLMISAEGQAEIEVMRDFFHQAAKALDEVSAESKCHEERLLIKPFLKQLSQLKQ